MAPTTPIISDPHPDANAEPAEWRPAEHNPDPRKWTDDEIAAGMNSLPIPECTLFVHRADRHDRTSDVQALTIECAGALSYNAITMIAGLFETPHITFAPTVRCPDDATGDPREYAAEIPEAYFLITVRWVELPPVSKRDNAEVSR